MYDKDGMAEIQSQKPVKVTPITSYQNNASGINYPKADETDTLEDIIWQYKNQTQQGKDWTYTKARHETPTDDMKTITHENNGQETTGDSNIKYNKYQAKKYSIDK